MTNYKSGRNFEYRVMRYLKGKGYLVTRSAGSHRPGDVLAGKGGVMYMIQCTTNVKSKGREDRDNLLMWAREFGAIPALAYIEKPRGPIVWEFLNVITD